MFERARANAMQRADSAILGCNFANICSLTTTYSLGCAAFLRLALLAIGFGPSGRCCLADKIALRDGRDGDDIVETHNDVGDHDKHHHAPQMRRRLDFVSVALVGHKKLGRDIQKRRPADQLEIRQRHETRDDRGENDAQEGGDADADEQSPATLVLPQSAARHGNDDGVVAR